MKQRLFTFIFLFLIAGAWGQSPEVPDQHEIHADYEQALIDQQQLIDFEQARVDQMFLYLIEIKEESQNELEKLFGDALVKKIKRDLYIKEYLELLNPPAKRDEIKIAILGNSERFFDKDGFQTDVLIKLLESIKKQQPNAVFFLGNMIYGLQLKETKAESQVQIPPEKNIFGKVVNKSVGFYDEALFKRQLEAFGNILQEQLGKEIPIYPLPGAHELVGPNTLELFLKRFPIADSQVFDSKALAYKVNIGNTLFLALTTDQYDVENNRVIENQILPQAFDWLSTQLNEEGPKQRFTFVLGIDPAFSPEASFGMYTGLDQNREERNRFWNLLMKNQVSAYVASKDVLYDRTFRYGVWQLITGGAGASRDIKGDEDETFYHYLLLTIPQDATSDPTITVYDLEGKKRDEFVLSRHPGTLFDMRISNSIKDLVVIPADDSLRVFLETNYLKPTPNENPE